MANNNNMMIKVTVVDLEMNYPSDTWKIRKPSSTIVWFWLVLIFSLCLSFPYAFGIWKLGDAFFVRPSNPTRISFNYAIITIAGLVIYISFFMHIWKQRENYKKYMNIITRFQTLLHHVPHSDSTYKLILISNLLLLWEITKFGYTDEAGRSIILNMPKYDVANFKDRRAKSTNRYAAIIAIDMLAEKIAERFNKSDNLYMSITTSTQIDNLREEMYSLITACDTGVAIFSIATAQKIFAVLYLIAAPMLQWLSDGEYILFTYPIVFLIVGSIVVFRFHVDDIFYKPVIVYSAPMNTELKSLFVIANNMAVSDGLFKENSFTYLSMYTKHSLLPI